MRCKSIVRLVFSSSFILMAYWNSPAIGAGVCTNNKRISERVGNLCFTIDGEAKSRLKHGSGGVRSALEALGTGPNSFEVYQGYRSSAHQRQIVIQRCGQGKSSCNGVAAPGKSRHQTSVAADTMTSLSDRSHCAALNRVAAEYIGATAGVAVYGTTDGVSYGHIDDRTGSNYQPKICPRNFGTSRAQGELKSERVAMYREMSKVKRPKGQAPRRRPPEQEPSAPGRPKWVDDVFGVVA